MPEMILALVRSLGTLSRRRVWWLVLSPAVAALAVWLTLTFLVLDQLSAWFLDQPPMSWLSGWGAVWLAKLRAAAGGWLHVGLLATGLPPWLVLTATVVYLLAYRRGIQGFRLIIVGIAVAEISSRLRVRAHVAGGGLAIGPGGGNGERVGRCALLDPADQRAQVVNGLSAGTTTAVGDAG